ncbi:MAG: SH3 domain-containing protein [Caldilinea sp.]|nr:SH3 domain-containing protein [Anaerolineales bacterium]MCW5843707.1 SH3 domain-containing protein [Caldilinea sp.]HRW47498.1 SH3 domain-containing protein [Caldilinea sp.]
MQRKSLALVAIAVTLITMLFLQLTVVQAATPQQAVVPADVGEPEELAQPIRIRIRQSIPFTISLAPAAEITATDDLTATAVVTDAEAPAETDAEAAPEIDATDAQTATEDTAAATEIATSETVTETEAAPADATVGATDELTATETMTAPELISSVPVTLEIELDFVVTQTLTTTVPASATIQLPDFQTRTVPIEVVVAPLADGEAIVEIIPVVEETPEPTATEEITATETATATVEATPVATSTLATAVNGIPVINTTVNAEANLRSGPGTNFEVVSQATPGQPVQIAAVSEDGGWYLLATGAWIATFLVDEQPANVPVVNDQILAAIQGTLPEPTPTPEATPVPAATQPVSPTVTVDANLRSGPGTTFEVLGGTVTGQAVNIVGRNADGTWFRLDNGGWVLGTLVANPPALESVPVVNDDGTPVEEPAAAPAETPAAGLGGLLPTPTPQAPAAAAPAADTEAYLTAAAELVGQFDVVLNSVDSLLAEVNGNPALISDSAWTTRMNAALTLLRRTSASVGELDVPAESEAIQTQLETAAASYIQAAQALSGAVQAADAAQLVEADALVSAATANLTAAESAIITAQGQ